jgi:hypothetical protein
MKLTMKTYLVSLQLPKVDAASDEDTWPAHRRVRASTVTRAIAQVHREEVARFNEYSAEELKDLGIENFAGRFQPSNFPIVEVKVVA